MSGTSGSTEERAAHYRTLALEAEACAAKSQSAEMQQNYLKVAKSWSDLALEAERWAQRLNRGPAGIQYRLSALTSSDQ